jgi:outer membrane protein assembly factor BamB
MPQPVWQDNQNRRFTSFAVTDRALLATGHPDGRESEAFLVSIDPQDGSDHWIVPIPAVAVKGGVALDHQGRIYVTLENGKLICYQPQ